MASASSPRLAVTVHDRDEITLSDGTILSATIWLPEDAAANPVPAILEYLPYRKRDLTALRDALNHPYVASHGYACVRVDMRGSGDSEGINYGEYLKQEQDDGLEILQWISGQQWCTGSIGMIGISWGGFNGLQIAARRPPELKAVLSLCSTDDRYADDVHYMGGCLLVENFTWGAQMFTMNGSPPDPDIVGDKWRDLWMSRLEAGGHYLTEWHQNQRRDDFWKHGSICEDYKAIQCPVYLMSGWADAYSNTVFRMLEHLQCPKKGLVGPWGHAYPNFAVPGPQIGFLQESIRWWDKWLKGKETGIMDEPILQCYLQDTVPPRTRYGFRPGHWAAESTWPSRDVVLRPMGLAAGRLVDGVSTSHEQLSICSPQTVGYASGRWCSFGLPGDLPGDQRQEAGGSLVFDSEAFVEPVDLLGAVVVHLRIASDKPNAFVAAVLSEVLPDGSATKLSFGLLNLTHHESHVDVKPLKAGQFYDVSIKLNECGQRIGPGSSIRLSLSSSYFPIAWPSPQTTTLTIDCARSKVDLPTRPHCLRDALLKPFEPAVTSTPLRTKLLRQGGRTNTRTQNVATGEEMIRIENDGGLSENEDNGWRWGQNVTTIYTIHPDDPLSARVEQRAKTEFGRDGTDLAIGTYNEMTVTETELHFTARIDAWEQGKQIFGRDFAFSVPRDYI